VAYDLHREPRAPDVVAWTASPGIEGYWRAHPDVIDVVSIPGAADDGRPGFDLRFWLRPMPDNDDAPTELKWPTRTKRPSRAHDFELSGGGELHPVFPGGPPDLEHTELFIGPEGDEAFPRGWWMMRVWVSRPPQAAISASPRTKIRAYQGRLAP
jgi:hypothetical protein